MSQTGEENLLDFQKDTAPIKKDPVMQRFFRLGGTYGMIAIMAVFVFMGCVVAYGNLKGYPAACAKACVAQGYDEGKFLVSDFSTKPAFSCECAMKAVNIPLPD